MGIFKLMMFITMTMMRRGCQNPKYYAGIRFKKDESLGNDDDNESL